MSPLDQIQDAPLTIKGWSPSNYTRKYRGPVTLREALARSINTVAVRLSEKTGRKKVRDLAARMGLSGTLAPGPAIALGTSETSLVEMTGIFATIANGGRRVTPTGVQSIALRGDSVPIDQASDSLGEQVISRRTAGLLTGMMKSVVYDGTGKRARLDGWEIAGKTGTTQRARDAWFIGYSSEFVAGVWMGYDDNRPLTGVTGGGLPAEIWRETMARIHTGLTPASLNAIEPKPAKPKPAPAKPKPPAQRKPDPQPSADESLVQSIFNEVVRDLGGDPNAASDPEARRERLNPGADR